MMTVRQLKDALEKFPNDWFIHLDVSRPFEGDRVVRALSGIRHQDGYNAVALDASEYNGNDVPGGIDVTIVP